MSKPILKSSRSAEEHHKGRHRYEHWYVDQQVYFITARCRDRFPAFEKEEPKTVFWDRFNHYTQATGFLPIVTSLLDNHYHTLGFLETGLNLKTLMQRLHGSVSKLVNDLLPERRREFFRDKKGKEYFDGCIRDETQFRRAYRYTWMQSRRHGVLWDYTKYVHEHVGMELEDAVRFCLERKGFLEGVPYKRYQRKDPARPT